MTDPKRWIEEGAPDEVRSLLVAAAAEHPGKGSVERTLSALGASGALAGARSAGAASAAKAASGAIAGKGALAAGRATVAIKWGLLGAVAALATAGTAGVVWKNTRSSQPATEQHSSMASPGAQRAPAPAPARVEEPNAASPPQDEPPPSTEPSPSGPGPTSGAGRSTPSERANREPAAATVSPPRESAETHEGVPSLAGEVAAIDAARAALREGNPANTLAILDDYARRFEKRHFDPEALYLRMEALGREGDGEGQRRAAERLLAEFPSAPQSARARAVIDPRR